jgi:hypothetical protein
MGALIRTGERKHTRYQLAIPQRHVTPMVLNEQGHLVQLGERTIQDVNVIV